MQSKIKKAEMSPSKRELMKPRQGEVITAPKKHQKQQQQKSSRHLLVRLWWMDATVASATQQQKAEKQLNSSKLIQFIYSAIINSLEILARLFESNAYTYASTSTKE